MTERRLIIGCDGARGGEDAVALGASLSRVLGALPVVVGVTSVRGASLGRGCALDERDLDRVAAAHGLERFETRAIADDVPARALREQIDENHAIAAVIGSAHRGAIGRALTGSVGSALLADARCALAVAPAGFARRGALGLLRAGVAVDGTEESEVALDAAIEIALAGNAELTVIAVTDPPGYTIAGAYPVADGMPIREACREGMERELDRAVARVPATLPVSRRLLSGDAVRRISEAAGALDLLVVGSRARGPVRRVLLGSVAERLTRAAPCPVLVVPRGAQTPMAQLRASIPAIPTAIPSAA